MIVVLAGGVGAARFLQGLAHIVNEEELVIIGNIGDDINLLGLHISPDLDTVMYTLAGVVDEVKGWGLKDDTFNFLNMLRRYGQEIWFNIGDRDLATHIIRTFLLSKGLSLSEVTRILTKNLGITQLILPVTDNPVRTKIDTGDTLLDFQEYFVKRKFENKVHNVVFEGSGVALPNPQVLESIGSARGIILAPSNPIVSIGCILSVPEIKESLKESKARKLAINPLIAGKPVRGPADLMMKGLGLEPSAIGVASIYRDLIDTFIIDEEDSNLKSSIESMALRAIVTRTLMDTFDSKIKLARVALEALED